jgi:hypothetical protein
MIPRNEMQNEPQELTKDEVAIIAAMTQEVRDAERILRDAEQRLAGAATMAIRLRRLTGRWTLSEDGRSVEPVPDALAGDPATVHSFPPLPAPGGEV